MVPQVPVVGILMIVNGALSVLMGLLLAVMGPLMFTILQQDRRQIAPQEEQVLTWLSGIYLGLGLFVLLAGVFNIGGGIAALRYRSRGLVLTALFFNILPLFTCYCSPTSLGILIFGLIVMFQADVTQAFAMGAEGYSAEEIKNKLGSVRRYPRRRRERDEDYDDDEPRRDQRDGAEDKPERPRKPPRGEPGDEGIQEV